MVAFSDYPKISSKFTVSLLVRLVTADAQHDSDVFDPYLRRSKAPDDFLPPYFPPAFCFVFLKCITPSSSYSCEINSSSPGAWRRRRVPRPLSNAPPRQPPHPRGQPWTLTQHHPFSSCESSCVSPRLHSAVLTRLSLKREFLLKGFMQSKEEVFF